MTAVEWQLNELQKIEKALANKVIDYKEFIKMEYEILEKAKEMEKEQIGYTESDMRSYASYILNNPVIEPSQWYKIYRNK